MDNLVKLKSIIQDILVAKGESAEFKIDPSINLKDDLNLESFDLVELVVALEDEFGVDIFESGAVHTVQDVLNKLK